MTKPQSGDYLRWFDQLSSGDTALVGGKQSLQATGKTIRRLFRHGKFPAAIEEEIRAAYAGLGRRCKDRELDVARGQESILSS